MRNEWLKQYRLFSKLLEQEKISYEDKALARLVKAVIETDNLSDEGEDIASVNHKHYFYQLSYTCLRIQTCCHLIMLGYREYIDQLKEDISQVVDNIKKIEYSWEVDDNLLQDSYDVLALLCSDYKKIIVSFFPKGISLSNNRTRGVSSDLFYIAVNMVDCLITNGDKENAAYVIEQLCAISRERNNEDNYRLLIVNVLPHIIDEIPELAYKICLNNKSSFEYEEGIEAGDFFWFYGCSANVLGYKEEGIYYLKRCIQSRKKTLGHNNWYTVVAECELVLQTMTSTRDKDARKYFERLIEGIEEKVYSDMERDYAIVLEGRCLFNLLHNDPDMDSKEQYNRYVDLFERLCNQTTNYPAPFLTPRIGKNVRGTICLRNEDFIGAEKNFLEALAIDCNIDPSGTILSDAQIKSNLLMAYFNQNDFENVSELLRELLDVIADENDNSLSEADVYRIYNILVSTYSYYDVNDDEIESILELAREECDSVIAKNSNLTIEDKEQATFICSAISILIQKMAINKADHWTFYKALNKIKQFSSNMQLEIRRTVALNYVLALLAYDLDIPTTGFYIRESLDSIYHYGVPEGIRIAVLSLAAIYYARGNQLSQSKKYLNEACTELNNTWEQGVRYLNDTRLMNALLLAQLQYHSIYSVQRQIFNTQTAYNYILQFKALASLAGRERNKVINSGLVDDDLMERIRQQQNQIAQFEVDTMKRIDEIEMKEAYSRLRSLEAEFAEHFPGIKGFTEISLERVIKAMPDNAVVIEYFDSVPYYGKTVFEMSDIDNEQCIDVFLLRKIHGVCTLGKYVIRNGEIVLRKADEFTKIYRNLSEDGATTEQLNSQEKIRYFLYNELIAPIKEHLQGVATVFIAPCSELINLPFGLLKEDSVSNRLQEDYVITMIECARDFLFSTSSEGMSSRSLIMGDPEYDLNKSRIDMKRLSDEQRFFDFHDYTINPLPFSGIEAFRISNIISADCCIGLNATKNRLLSAENYRCIHLATHGVVDYESSADTLYASCILLTGAQNWLSDGISNKSLGNGIVTADEISRQDWKNVDLVVLSTCMSGLNDFSINKGFNGMVSALSAAGVKYVICSLWNQSDVGTAVMMEEFYRLYVQERKTPCEAIREAQIYLKNITIRELKDKKWLSIGDVRVQPVLEVYRNMNDRRKPFRDEVYWGGFECFRCN